MIEKEYESLRKEILEWQNRRFTVASASLVAVTGILGWTLNHPDIFSWGTVSGCLLIIISFACYLSYLFGLSKTKISTYIEVFYESEDPRVCWERRQRSLKKTPSRHAFAWLYIFVALVGTITPIFFCTKALNYMELAFFFFGVTCFGVGIWVLGGKPQPYGRYVQIWNEVKGQDTKQNAENKINEKAIEDSI